MGRKATSCPSTKDCPTAPAPAIPSTPHGFKTAYLWEHTLQKETLSDILSNYALIDYGEAKTQKRVPHIMKNARVLIFPRYHQLDVVQRLTQDAVRVGMGRTYLIEHSAGSGKSNSLT